jgi:hypothetical protein
MNKQPKLNKNGSVKSRGIEDCQQIAELTAEQCMAIGRLR